VDSNSKHLLWYYFRHHYGFSSNSVDMVSMMKKTLKIGDKVMSRYGEARVTKLEMTERPGDKYGLEVQEVFTSMLEYVIMDLDNGHWSYGQNVEVL